MTETEENLPWYGVVDKQKTLAQGDIILDCPFLEAKSSTDLPKEGETPSKTEADGNVTYYNVIVISQSCDIENKKIDLVLLCPVWTLSEMLGKERKIVNELYKEDIRQGFVHRYHMLDACDIEGHKSEIRIVDFGNAFSMPFNLMMEQASKSDRLRLMPPYREHLSQAFARFFMRVGLPTGIPPFKVEKDPMKVLRLRLSYGEITEDEFNRLKKALQKS